MPRPNVNLVLAQIANLAQAGVNAQGGIQAVQANGGALLPDDLTPMERQCLRLAEEHERNGMDGMVEMTKLSIIGERAKNADIQNRLANLEGFAGGLVGAMQQAAQAKQAQPRRKVVNQNAPKRLGR